MAFADEGGEGTGKSVGPSNVLVLAPTMSHQREAACQELLGEGAQEVLTVAYEYSAREWVNRHLNQVESPPGRVSVVDVGGTTRSTADPDTDSTAVDELRVDTVEHPEDLTGVGIEISEHLRALGTAPPQNRATETVVCFDSLTTLLQYVSTERAFRFLHVFTSKIAKLGATAHFHLDPDAHDPQTVATLQSLFDAIVEVDGADWTVRTR